MKVQIQSVACQSASNPPGLLYLNHRMVSSLLKMILSYCFEAVEGAAGSQGYMSPVPNISVFYPY